jgi:hypothetical protein
VALRQILSGRLRLSLKSLDQHLDRSVAGLYRGRMTVKLELRPEVHASLLAQAQARGLSLEVYLEQVVRERAAVTSNNERSSRKSLPQVFAESPMKGLDSTLSAIPTPADPSRYERIPTGYVPSELTRAIRSQRREVVERSG